MEKIRYSLMSIILVIGFLPRFMTPQSVNIKGGHVHLEQKSIVWSGALDDFSYRQFKILLKRHVVEAILFQDVSGGTRGVARRLIELISDYELNTAAKGACLSACALAFLAGKHRVLLATERGLPTTLAFHGYYDSADNHLVGPTSDEISYVVNNTHGGISKELATKALTTSTPAGGLFIFERPVPSSSGSDYISAALCDVSANSGNLRCIPIFGADPRTLGLLR